jgi:hypothetical protein
MPWYISKSSKKSCKITYNRVWKFCEFFQLKLVRKSWKKCFKFESEIYDLYAHRVSNKRMRNRNETEHHCAVHLK